MFDGRVLPSVLGTLTFSPVLRGDDGLYTCTATNAAGTISAEVELNVLCEW